MRENALLGSLSRDVFEQRTSTGSELFSLLVCLDANKFVLLSFFALIKTIYPRVSTEPLPNDAKSSLPVDVRRSKTLLLKLPINNLGRVFQSWGQFTVEARLTATSVIRSPRYYGHYYLAAWQNGQTFFCKKKTLVDTVTR